MRSSRAPLTTSADPAIEAARGFLERLFPSPRPFRIRLWNGSELEGDEHFTLVLRHPGSLRRMFKPPIELAMGEAYLRGDFEIEGDLIQAFDLVSLASRNFGSPAGLLELVRRFRSLPTDPPTAELDTHAPARLRGQVHTSQRDREAIQYHYDVGNDFYKLFLDDRMIYSCGYFPEGIETLDRAQEKKLELICRKLRLRPGVRLLDIGCGWGGLLAYAAERHGVLGLGVTLSAEQHRLASERVRTSGLEEQLRIELRDYRFLEDESFDRIVSVGMFEHVGREQAPDYFTQVHRLLKGDGLFLNHAISTNPTLYQEQHRKLLPRMLRWILVGQFEFRKRYIFPDGELLAVSEANGHAERAGFEVRDVESWREHYALTLRHWLERLRARRAEAIAASNEAVFRLWELYLAASIFHFETARIGIHQSLFTKAAGVCTALPRTRADLYREVTSTGPELPSSVA